MHKARNILIIIIFIEILISLIFIGIILTKLIDNYNELNKRINVIEIIESR